MEIDYEVDPAELYHENSKLAWSDDELFAWYGFVASAPALQDTLSRPYKRYRGKPVTLLAPLVIARKGYYTEG